MKNIIVRIKDFLVFIAGRSLVILLFIAVWELVARLKIVNPIFIPPFSEIVVVIGKLISSGELFADFAISMKRSLTGYLLGIAVAIPLGLCIGRFRRLEHFLDPLFQLFRNISTLALMPIFLLLLGIGETSKIGLIFWGVLWVNLMNTIAGVKSIDPLLTKAARALSMPRFMMFYKIIFPAALPSIFVGLRLSATTSILILTAAEMMGATSGLGYKVRYFQMQIMIPEMYAYIIVMAILGLVINYSLAAFERKVFKRREFAL